MSILLEQSLNLFLMQETLWMLTKTISNTNYNFHFEQFFHAQHKWQLPSALKAVARIGAIDNYAETYEALQNDGISLINNPDEHLKASDLTYWYPLLSDLSPKSIWFSELPSPSQISQEFTFPIFLKGARQTSRHQKHLSIIENEEALSKVLEIYAQDPILHWQTLVCREYINLRPVTGGSQDAIPASFEFRTFWWKGEFVGSGRYWYEADSYQWTSKEQESALALAQIAAKRLNLPFLVIDLAQTLDENWIIIECNDAQESGYAGTSPFSLWKNILALEKKALDEA